MSNIEELRMLHLDADVQGLFGIGSDTFLLNSEHRRNRIIEAAGILSDYNRRCTVPLHRMRNIDLGDRDPVEHVTALLETLPPLKPVETLLEMMRQAHRQILSQRTPSDHPFWIGDYLEICTKVHREIWLSMEPPTELLIPVNPSLDWVFYLQVALHRRGYNSRLIHEFTPPHSDDPCYRSKVRLAISNEHVNHSPYASGIYVLPEPSHLTEENGLAFYLNFFEVLVRYETKKAPIEAVYEFIGDLSEGAFNISYDEDSIRDAWVSGRLNEKIRDAVVDSPWQRNKFEGCMGEAYREDADYETRLTDLIARIDAWPAHWSNDPNDLARLTKAEKLKALPHQGDFWLVKALGEHAEVIAAYTQADLSY
jgi:hypothetical protein